MVAEVVIPIVAAAVGAFIGSIGTYYVSKRKREEKKSGVRLALEKEIEATSAMMEVWYDRIDEKESEVPTPFPGFINPVVFESVAANLGQLSNDEVEAIVEYYSAQSILLHTADRLSDSEEITVPNKMVRNVNELRGQALEELQNNLE